MRFRFLDCLVRRPSGLDGGETSFFVFFAESVRIIFGRGDVLVGVLAVLFGRLAHRLLGTTLGQQLRAVSKARSEQRTLRTTSFGCSGGIFVLGLEAFDFFSQGGVG